LQEVSGELHAPLLSGGTPDWVSLSYEHLVPQLRGLGLLSETDLKVGPAYLNNVSSRYLPPLMVTAWGQRAA
jgi:hypothetical protein